MKKTLSAYDLHDEFKACGRDYFSLNGYEALLEYYDEIDSEMELDVIAICCDCTEYGSYCTCDYDDLEKDYSFILSREEYMKENEVPESEWNDETYSDYISELVKIIEDRTTVLKFDVCGSTNYIIFAF